MRYRLTVYILLILAWGCSPAPRYTSFPVRSKQTAASALPEKPPIGTKFRGLASFYAEKYHGRKTASGEIFDMYGLTCAHSTLAFNTWLEVRNLSSSRTVIVRVNDRGPFAEGRILDLSYGAAKELGMLLTGVQEVECTVIK